MKLNWSVRFFGLIDAAFVAWLFIVDIAHNKIPLYSTFIESMQVANAFGEGSGLYLIPVILGFLLMLSLIVSAVLMLTLNKMGVFISIIQFPFRVFTLIPLTFFMLHQYINSAFNSALLSFSVLVILEMAKLFVQVLWLKDNKIH